MIEDTRAWYAEMRRKKDRCMCTPVNLVQDI